MSETLFGFPVVEITLTEEQAEIVRLRSETREHDAELKRLRADVERPLDVLRVWDCGHVYTLRNSTCPECFAQLRDKNEALLKVVRDIARATDSNPGGAGPAVSQSSAANRLATKALAALEVEPKRCTCAEKLQRAEIDKAHFLTQWIGAGNHFEDCPAEKVDRG